jgi:hypothetical protein
VELEVAMWVEAPTIEVSQTKGSCTVRVISYTTRCDFILDGGGGNPRLTTDAAALR